jgi:ribosomal protein L11 methyltransferase
MTLHNDPEAARWRVLTAVVPQAVDDEIAAVLGGGSLGVEIVPAGPGTSALRIYLGAGDDADAWRRRARDVLAAHGVDAPGADPTVESVADDRWVERWQASLAPIPLGERFVVLPHGGDAGDGGRAPIVLVPGMAFGTGEHETTRMCAVAVEALTSPGSRWLDLGTGTGILAVVAALRGAARVLALDLDPEAAHVASEVVSANGLAGRVEVRAGSIADRDGERFDGIVANIQSSFFLVHAHELAAALVGGGLLVVSGVLVDDLPEIEAALEAAGLAVQTRASDGPWARLVARNGIP